MWPPHLTTVMTDLSPHLSSPWRFRVLRQVPKILPDPSVFCVSKVLVLQSLLVFLLTQIFTFNFLLISCQCSSHFERKEMGLWVNIQTKVPYLSIIYKSPMCLLPHIREEKNVFWLSTCAGVKVVDKIYISGKCCILCCILGILTFWERL